MPSVHGGKQVTLTAVLRGTNGFGGLGSPNDVVREEPFEERRVRRAHDQRVGDRPGRQHVGRVDVPVTVISSYVPTTLEERLGEREYLAALLAFAQEQVKVPGTPSAPLDTRTLVGVLGQPADRLSQPLSAAGRSISPGRGERNLLRH